MADILKVCTVLSNPVKGYNRLCDCFLGLSFIQPIAANICGTCV